MCTKCLLSFLKNRGKCSALHFLHVLGRQEICVCNVRQNLYLEVCEHPDLSLLAGVFLSCYSVTDALVLDHFSDHESFILCTKSSVKLPVLDIFETMVIISSMCTCRNRILGIICKSIWERNPACVYKLQIASD